MAQVEKRGHVKHCLVNHKKEKMFYKKPASKPDALPQLGKLRPILEMEFGLLISVH